MNTILRLLVLSLFIVIGSLGLFASSAEAVNASIYAERLINQGFEFEKAGRFEEALAKYQESLAIKLTMERWEQASAYGSIRRLYIKWSKYEEAHKATKWFLEGQEKLRTRTKELVWEVDALIEFQKTGNPQKIIEYIEHLKKEYTVSLPPKPWNGGTPTITGKLFRLYNLIGDHNSGITLVDACIEMFKNTSKGKYDPIKASEPYLKVREGFERDKAEGFKGCAQSPPGVICMGHATRALIQSREFSW